MDIIYFQAAKSERDRPDEEHIRRDEFGREMYRFLLEYFFEGEEWGAELWAYSRADAEARVTAMRGTLKLVGQVHAMQRW
jgi:hypothetical protein